MIKVYDDRPILSVSLDDCEVTYERGTGPGGQKRNKTESKARVHHAPSGATAVSDETRSQHKNKATAFLRMIRTPKFMAWHNLEIARRLGHLRDLDAKVDGMMKDIKVEGKVDNKWTVIE